MMDSGGVEAMGAASSLMLWALILQTGVQYSVVKNTRNWLKLPWLISHYVIQVFFE